MDLNLYKIDEINDLRFYQLQKDWLNNPCYRYALLSDAKLVYAILLDRMELSRKNHWVDKESHLFLLYTKDTIAELLGIGQSTAYKAFKDLVRCKLMKQVRQGLNKPNELCIGKVRPNFSFAGDTSFSGICKICGAGCAYLADPDLCDITENDTYYRH